MSEHCSKIIHSRAIKKILSSYNSCISYSPLKNEVEPETLPFLPQGIDTTNIPSSPTTDPIGLAEELHNHYKNTSTFILIPGSSFDREGTRHGRGGGWYDRFLSKVPREWLRVGVTDLAHLSQEKLKREKWDEPMDLVVWEEDGLWQGVVVDD